MTRKCALTGVFAMFAALGAAAMPTKAEFQKVLPLVKELSAEDNAAVKAGTLTPKEAGDRALERASDTSLDEASRYLFFEAAFAYYVSATEYDKAAEVVGKLRSEINDVPDAAVIEFIERRLRKVKREHAGRLYELLQDARTRSQVGARIATYQKTVKANPGDTISQARLAYCQVLVRNWDEALKAFAKSDGEVAKMAKAELAGKGKSAVELGDFWWGFTINDYNFRNYAEQLAEEFKAHAATQYAKALVDGGVTGLKKALVEKRIKDSGLVASSHTETAPLLFELPKEGRGSDVTLQLDKDRSMAFVFCPAGKYKMGYNKSPSCLKMHAVQISRPFWMAKVPVTYALLDLLMGKTERKTCKSGVPAYKFDVLGGDSAPAAMTYNQAKSVLAELSRRYSQELPKGYVFRFPSEAEYEYAAKSGRSKYNVKDDGAGEITTFAERVKALERKGHKVEDAEQKPWRVPYLAVASKNANAWGLYDMYTAGWAFLLDTVRGNKDECDTEVMTPFYKEGCVDPLQLAEGDDAWGIACNCGWGYYDVKYKGKGRMKQLVERGDAFHEDCFLRVVIGPDLMKEKGFDKK